MQCISLLKMKKINGRRDPDITTKLIDFQSRFEKIWRSFEELGRSNTYIEFVIKLSDVVVYVYSGISGEKMTRISSNL